MAARAGENFPKLSILTSKAVVLLLLIHCLLLLPLFVGICVWSLLCISVLSVISKFFNHFAEEERDGCFTLIVFLLLCDC